MADNHPAKIAKYLLKGWCLLNEYCPNGQNIPLVRSREGQLVCAGCDKSCPYYNTHGEPQQLGAGAPLPVATPAQGATAPPLSPQPAAPPPALAALAAAEFKEPIAYQSPPVVAPAITSLSSSPMRMGNTVASGSAEVTLQTPESRFSCVRLDYRSGGVPRLLGETYTAKVRANLSSPGSSPDVSVVLQEAFSNDACRQLSDRILMPERCPGADISRNQGQVTVSLLQDGRHISVPEAECVFLQGVTPEYVAKALTEVLLGRDDIVGNLQNSGVRWIEVSLNTVSGEVTYRRSLRSQYGEGAAAATLAVANDW